MNTHHIEALCAHFSLGKIVKPPQRVYGGLLHRMWRIDTDKTSYAVKQLSKDINLTDERIVKNYECSERIASGFIVQGIPGVCAIEKSGKYLFMIDDIGFLVYPWVDAKARDQHMVSENHAVKIAAILAKMHALHVDEPEMTGLEFSTVTKEKMLAFIDKAEIFDCPFAKDLKKNQSELLAANEAYQNAIPILKTHVVISHGDLDQKNVLWDSDNNPILIDWESACKVNPTYDIINTAFYWSGITTHFNQNVFFKMIETYQKEGGVIHADHLIAACNGAFSWIGWLVYNIERACVQEESEHRTIGIEQVNQTLATILRLQMVIPALTKNIVEKL